MNGRELVLAYDLGGTKVQAGIVTRDGHIAAQAKEYVVKSQGPSAVRDQLVRMGEVLLASFPAAFRIGIASAGPLNPKTGELLDPTNLTTSGTSWGVWPVAHELEWRLKLPAVLENDAAAAVLAERWKGRAQSVDNVVVMTLGTGVGVGVLVEGRLVRSGRGLHPEAGHISLDINDATAPCGCGKLGCIEAYLSGTNFTARMARAWQEPGLTARVIAERAKSGDPRALKAFDEYARYFAAALDELVVLYAPELIVISGGFAQTAEYFLENVHPYLEKSLARRRVGIDLYPRLLVTEHKTEIGLLGAAYVAFNH